MSTGERAARTKRVVAVSTAVAAALWGGSHALAADRTFNVSLVGSLNPLQPTLGSTNNIYSDLWGEGDLVALGSVSGGSGVTLINNANPASPVMVGRYAPAGNANGQFRDVIIRDGIGYFAIDSSTTGGPTTLGGIHIVNLSNPATPTKIAEINAPQGFINNHDLFLDGNFLYVTDNRNNVLKVWNVSNPALPTKVRDITTAGSATSNLHDMTVKNGRMYTANLDNGITQIYDVSNMSVSVAPTLLGTITVPEGTRNHGTYPSEDGKLLAVAREAENSQVYLYDITNPASPILRSTISPAAYGIDSFSAHIPIIVGETLFVSWYQAGLQVFNIKNPATPVHLGAYDTWVGGNGGPTAPGSFSGWDGNWGVQVDGPDKILLSDFDNGFLNVDATEALRQTWNLNANAAWQNASRWENGAGVTPIIPDGGELIAAFTNASAGTTRTVTVDGSLTPARPRVMGMDFSSALLYTLDPVNGGEIELLNTFGPTAKITVNNAGSFGVNRVNVPLVLSDNLLVQNSASSFNNLAPLELGEIRGTGRTITFAGTGETAMVAASPSFSGSVALVGGKLTLRHGQAVNSQPINVSAGTLVLRNNAATTNYGSDVTFTGTSFLAIGNGGGLGTGQTQQLDDVIIAPTGAVTLVRNNGNHFRASNVTVNGTMTISPQSGAPVASRFGTLAVSSTTGRLNVQDAPLVITATPLATIEQMVQLGANGGAWNGHGIVTGQSAALTGLTSLGIATASQTGHATFGGLPVAGDDVLLMYTYAGDANLDGFISGDDYASIDFAISQPAATGWFNGDFNHDGIISGDDYSVIDFNIVAQGAPFPTSGSAESFSTVTAVPEPSAVTGAIAALAASLTRRTRRRTRS